MTEQALAARFDRAVSWLAFGMLAGVVGAFAWYVPTDRQVLLQVFAEYGVALPRSAAVVAAVPDIAIIALAVVAVAGALFVQLRIGSARSAAVFNLFLAVGFGLLVIAYRAAMRDAVLVLMHDLSQ